MREEEGMSKRCECQCLLEGWEGSGWRRLKLFLAGSQRDNGRHILPHTHYVWYVVGFLSGGSLPMLRVLSGR